MQVKRFNWTKRPTHYEFAQAWRNQRRNMTQRFLDDGATASSSLLNAQNNLTTGMATLAAQASIQRTQAAISASKSQLLNLLA